MVILFTVVTIKNRRSGESMSGFIWRSAAKVCVNVHPIRRFRELWYNENEDSVHESCQHFTGHSV